MTWIAIAQAHGITYKQSYLYREQDPGYQLNLEDYLHVLMVLYIQVLFERYLPNMRAGDG